MEGLSQKRNLQLPYDPAITPGLLAQRNGNYVHTKPVRECSWGLYLSQPPGPGSSPDAPGQVNGQLHLGISMAQKQQSE